MMAIEVTYRVGSIDDPTNVAKTAATPDLAKLAVGGLSRTGCLVLEQTEWEERDGHMRPVRTVIVDAEHRPGEWQLGWPENGLSGLTA